MRVRVFSLPWVDPGGFDDHELAEFSAAHVVVDVYEHFFVHDNLPRLVVVLTYREVIAPTVDRRRSRGPAGVAPEEEARLTAEERERYDTLRRWRNASAKQTGKPAYLILTNRQALQIAQRPPATVAELGDVPGIGPARIAEYGEQILGLLSSAAEPEQEAPA